MSAISSKRSIPKHVALVIDGTRRWASKRNLSIADGQRRTWKKVIDSFDWFFLRGVDVVSYQVFPPSRWERPEAENDQFLAYLREIVDEELVELQKKEYRIRFSGRLFELSPDMQQWCALIEQKTMGNKEGVAHICLNYDGHCELLDAVKTIIRNKLSEEQIHEGIIRKYLYAGELPDPQVVIQFGGRSTRDNFLLWQSSGAEDMFMSKLWPDFEEMDVMRILEEYNARQSE